ncbi:HNH endonuclease family protein [Plantactinospora sp. GCM10030261]|uniref:HNH endonuclease family protein n=1 Tax=Plantactinospora sp. GCM10030261 TaxID=3273420 RepID=UPI0036132F9F
MHTRRTTSRSFAFVAALAFAAGGCTQVAAPETNTSRDPAAAAEAARQLDQLTVASAVSMRGYSRDRFPHWRDTGKNCDVRDTVLKRDGTDVRLSGCNVVGGRWTSVYDGKDFTDPADVDVDHMVPLANAWRSGASKWTDEQRGDFANDLDRPQLFAVSAASNRSKGDQDPAQWQPPNRDYWCQYATDWVTVKHHWRLTVTSAEKTALADMLERC